MNKIKSSGFFRIISLILIITFISLDIAYASEINFFKLAAPSSFSNLKGIEFKEAAQVQIGIRTALRNLASFDIASLNALGRRQFAERTVFAKKISGTMYFDEAKTCELGDKKLYTESGSYLIKAQTAGGVTYYGLISNKKDGKGYDVSVVPERIIAEALQKGTVKFTHESINQKDKAVIAVYTEHELSTESNVAIDEWIMEKMKRGEYAVGYHTEDTSDLYKNAQREIFLTQFLPILDNIAATLKTIGVKNENIKKIKDALLSKTLVLIPYAENDLPYVTIGGELIKATAHSSFFATYVFVPRLLYEASIVKWTIENIGWGEGIQNLIERELIHEIGAMCGLKVTVEDGKIWNELDAAVAMLKQGAKFVSSEELKNITPINLLDLELRNDYAAGNAEGLKEKFKQALAGVVIVSWIAFYTWVAGYVVYDKMYHRGVFEVEPVSKQRVEEIQKESPDGLIALLKHKNLNVRIVAAEKLGELRYEKAPGALAEAAKNEDVREAVIKALGKIRNHDAGIALLSMAKHTPYMTETAVAYTASLDYALECAASKELESIVESTTDIPLLMEIIDAWSVQVGIDIKVKAIQRLGKIGDESCAKKLRSISRSSYTKLQFSVAKAAKEAAKNIEKTHSKKKGTPAAKPADDSMLNTQPKVSEETISAMSNIGESIPHLNKIGFGEMWRVEKVTDILWSAGTGAISTATAKDELANLAPEVGATVVEREAVYDDWLKKAVLLVGVLATLHAAKYTKPGDDDIRLIVTRIKEAGVEVFIPKSQFLGDTISKYRAVIETIGGKLRAYQQIEDLQAMIKNPAKSIVMTVDVAGTDGELLKALKVNAEGLRFMNFAKMDDLDKMSSNELDNYQAEILSILLVARVITPEDFQDKGSATYRMLAHLLENYMPDGITVENYIQDIVTNAARLIKTILKALPPAVYKAMRQSVEVLWAA